MQTLAIIEIDEGALALTFGVRVGSRIHVTRCHRVALPDQNRDTLINVLRPLATEMLQNTPGVHVILGDRRAQHFVSVLPKMSPAEATDFMVREALRVTSMPAPAEVMVGVRLVRQFKGGRTVVGATALPRTVWEPLREAFRACNIQVLGLHSTEACLAAGAFATMRHAGRVGKESTSNERCAVVEVGGGRARFVLCDGKSAAQVRRFMVSNSDNNPEALVTQLAMELPRTIDWLRESGYQAPSVLVLGNRIGIGDESLELIRGELEQVMRAEAVEVTGDVVPSLATTGLLQELAGEMPLPPLSTEPVLRMPPPKWWPLVMPTIAAAGGLCSLFALQQHRAALEMQAQAAEAREEGASLRRRLVAADVEIRSPDESQAHAKQLAIAVGMRRPISRLVADVSNGVPNEIRLDGLQFATNERVVVTGLVRSSSRTAALAALESFSDQMRALLFLQSDAQEDVTEVPGQQNQFRFRLGMAWRQS